MIFVNALNKFGTGPRPTSNVRSLNEQFEDINVLNIDKESSTLPVNKLIIISDSTSVCANGFIVSDADEELLILISFKEITNLKSLQVYALTNTIDELKDEMDISQPKEINIYKIKNLNINFDDLSSIKPDKSINCKPKKLENGQTIKLHKFTKTKYLAIYIKSNQNGTENTFINAISFKKQETKTKTTTTTKNQFNFGGMYDATDKDMISINKWMKRKGYKISDAALTKMRNDGFDKVKIMALIHKKNTADLLAAVVSKSNEDMFAFTDDLQNQNELDYNILCRELLVFGFWRHIFDVSNRRISIDLIEIIIKFLGFFVEIDSVVLTQNEKDILTNILIKNVIKKMKNPQKIKLNLLYRMSRDGGLKKFQSLCNNKHPLLFVFHSKFNHVCGVFQSIPLKMGGGPKSDKHCFLFLLRSSFGHKARIWRVTTDENDVIGRYNVVVDWDKYYPSWGYAGMGNCIFVYKSDSYTMNSKTFEYKSGNALLGGDKYYQKGYGDYRAGPIKEYEVYQITID